MNHSDAGSLSRLTYRDIEELAESTEEILRMPARVSNPFYPEHGFTLASKG